MQALPLYSVKTEITEDGKMNHYVVFNEILNKHKSPEFLKKVKDLTGELSDVVVSQMQAISDEEYDNFEFTECSFNDMEGRAKAIWDAEQRVIKISD